MDSRKTLSPLIILLICTGLCVVQTEDEQHDAREGEEITLQCRFQAASLPLGETLTSYWMRVTPIAHENVAIGDVALENNYQVAYSPSQGRYDLLIHNVSYERDNGRFECRVKAGGSGRARQLHSQGHSLTVLTPPRAPTVTPGGHAHAQEGTELRLACSTSGGSPEPDIKWFRNGSPYPLEAEVTHGTTRSEPSVATLILQPKPEDDNASFQCSVWNRAMPEGQNFHATVDLSVNYFPRVDVGPENPLRVEVDDVATMECKVDAKPAVNSVRWTRNGQYISSSFTHIIQGVTVEDAGKYTCSADNGLGRTGEKEIYLDVLYPPTVTIASKTYEAEEGGTVEIPCEVSANPAPISIEWTMEEKPEFRLKANTLVLRNVNAGMAGTYVCRAVNLITTSTGKTAERSSSSSVAVLVRHKPGRAHISPERPVAQEGMGVTLVCSAKPPGWPAPQYRWYRDNGDGESKTVVVATGNTFNIPSANLGSEGIYRCQATNELGHGEFASVTLEVHQPPRFQTKLTPHMTKRSGEQDYSVSCSALGKPQPNVKWYKSNVEIKTDTELFDIKTEINEASNDVYNVMSMLKFVGRARPVSNELMPDDRGIYTCAFENEVKKVESTMHLRIEHLPISIQQKNKVAYDLAEKAEMSCRVQAYPKPEFQWFYGANTAPLSNDGHYDIDTTTDNNDTYLSKLRIKSLKSQDYGDYYCRAKNALGQIQPQIRLQPKGAPDTPMSLVAEKIEPSYVTLKWEAGFDGGLASTKYFVRYRRAAAASVDSCSQNAPTTDFMEYDCGRSNPCNVTRLEQHTPYTFKVKAVNTKGQSNYSNEILVSTRVDTIPPPEQVTYDPSAHTVTFSVAATCLRLMGVIETAVSSGWQVVDTVPLRVSGTGSTVQEAPLELPPPQARSSARRMSEPQAEDVSPRVRVKLCLQVNEEVCSESTDAEIGQSYIKEAAMPMSTLIAILISAIGFILFLTLLVIYVLKRRTENSKKKKANDYERKSMTPVMVSPQCQAPPPYYPSAGMENKALEHSMDLALMADEPKNAVYATQSGYGYISPHTQTHPGQNIANSDWNMGFIENSYTNSNNGGSVNSQDSLWQMKMSGQQGTLRVPHQMMDRQSNYGYDGVGHGAYGTLDEYAPYGPTGGVGVVEGGTGAGSVGAPDYRGHTPSRQDYCSDPYASVHKPKKRPDQHIESPYHEVSGLPEAYGRPESEQVPHAPGPPPHLSLSYDDSLESGYSTPNSRARRVIREIIV